MRCQLRNNGLHRSRPAGVKAAVVLFGILVLMGRGAHAAWLIDEARFHASAHGRLSCAACHDDISERQVHPDPEAVNKSLRDFFSTAQCAACHDAVMDEIQAGVHGGGKGVHGQSADDCIGCHDAHDPSSPPDSPAGMGALRSGDHDCDACHEPRTQLPELSAEDEQCMGCHRWRPPEDAAISHLCFHCHGGRVSNQRDKGFPQYPLMDVDAYQTSVHSGISCRICHPGSAGFKHSEQRSGDCRGCHPPHHEKVAHDAHSRVACEACHLRQITPVKQKEGGGIGWRKRPPANGASAIHDMAGANRGGTCARCHYQGNGLGAAAMALPAKSVMCAVCHTATFSVGDTMTLVALVFFGFGMLNAGLIWFSDGIAGLAKTSRSFLPSILSVRAASTLKILVLDCLLLRRLFRISKTRWVIHSLVYYPIAFRCCWGAVALASSLMFPEENFTSAMLDKNHPANAFLFDLSGLLVVIGVFAIMARKHMGRSGKNAAGLPAPRLLASGLLGSIVIVGFILEGMRIAMTGPEAGAGYAFLGYGISRLFSGFDLSGIYGYVWYGHAALTGAFLVSLPFSRMLHMIMAPVSLALRKPCAADRPPSVVNRSIR